MLTPFVFAKQGGIGEKVMMGDLNDHPVQEVKQEPKKEVVSRSYALSEIARCESGDRHYDKNGEVIRGKVNPLDIGRYQINLKYHQTTAEKMGLDLFDEEDNETYAMFLYKTQGAKPWKASNPCHHLLG